MVESKIEKSLYYNYEYVNIINTSVSNVAPQSITYLWFPYVGIMFYTIQRINVCDKNKVAGVKKGQEGALQTGLTLTVLTKLSGFDFSTLFKVLDMVAFWNFYCFILFISFFFGISQC